MIPAVNFSEEFEAIIREERKESKVPTLRNLAAQHVYLYNNIQQAQRVLPADLREEILQPRVIHILPILAQSKKIADKAKVFNKLYQLARIDPTYYQSTNYFYRLFFQETPEQFYCEKLASTIQLKDPVLLRKIRLCTELYDYQHYNTFQRFFATLGKDIKNYHTELVFAFKLFFTTRDPVESRAADAVIQTRFAGRLVSPLTSLFLLTAAVALPIILGILHFAGTMVIVSALALAKASGALALGGIADLGLDFIFKSLLESINHEELEQFRPLGQSMHDKEFLKKHLETGFNNLRSKVPGRLMGLLEQATNKAAVGA